jgi:hypothetical protein
MHPSGHNGQTAGKVYVTVAGLPLIFDLRWPFHRSTAGADFWVLHANLTLGNSGGLHAQVAVNVSATVREVLPSLEAKDAEGPVINSLRKQVDRKQLEFTKSPKLVPVHFSSRYYDFKGGRWVFEQASDEDLAKFVLRKVFWQRELLGEKSWLGDPTEALYLGKTVGQMLHSAARLLESGLIRMDAEWATATDHLVEKSEQFSADMRAALVELERKHAFEDGRKK